MLGVRRDRGGAVKGKGRAACFDCDGACLVTRDERDHLIATREGWQHRGRE